jgi:hypothetical protein
MWATVCQIAELPVAAASRTGAAVTVTDLAPAVELVRRIMRQDRDLSAKLLRKAVVNLEAIFGGGMAGRDFGSNFEAGMAVMGLESPDGAGGVVFKGDAGAALGELDAQAARALADMVIVLMTLLVAAPEERPRQTGWSYYVDLHTGVPNRDVETDAYDFVSWIAILLGRLSNGGLLKGDVPFLASPWGYVPVLTQEGWYPVPNKTAKLVDGIAPLQRYWDGSQWTDRVRIRNSGHWQEGSLPIHAPPDE